MRNVQLVIFDWDGTLADSASQIVGAMQRAIVALQLPPRSDQAIAELIGLGLNDALLKLYPDADLGHLRRLLDSYRAQWLAEGAGEAALFAGALDALQALRRDGLRLAIATGKSRRGLDRSLAHHDAIRGLIVNSRTADETASKPDPLMLRELLADEGLQAEQALMIGDTEYDVAMAAAIGMPAIGVTCGVHAPQRLLQAGARTLLESVADLPAWLATARSA
ncbi:HAD family hydrolase [Solimonas terrae]|uniref:HAD-IA family hydrolase n=1 Tax=Solimonas terrae TaxID=1396819 RepID=A0A6M2BYE0_9GAMM|nr:HAD-IA family hydrolase [Solimonas terrae]NGY06817.1 HAD-IA family hydrolase [Solimonas terrae]